MEIISSQSFLHENFLMARCLPCIISSGYSAVWLGKTWGSVETLSREISGCHALCTMGVRFRCSASTVEMTMGRSGIYVIHGMGFHDIDSAWIVAFFSFVIIIFKYLNEFYDNYRLRYG